MNNLQIKTRLIDGAAVVYPGPYLNQLRGEIIEQRCNQLIGDGVRCIIINFSETELINSIGISILLGIIESVNDASGSLVLTNLNNSSHELFEMLGLLSHIKVVETEEDALRTWCGQLETAGKC